MATINFQSTAKCFPNGYFVYEKIYTYLLIFFKNHPYIIKYMNIQKKNKKKIFYPATHLIERKLLYEVMILGLDSIWRVLFMLQ